MNGFASLGTFDSPGRGGNANSWIDPDDALYSSLTLWSDGNHNGVSEINEMRSLAEAGLDAISLQLEESRRRDPAGNLIRFVSRIVVDGRSKGRAFDVYLVGQR